jgi:hypothetical protein
MHGGFPVLKVLAKMLLFHDLLISHNELFDILEKQAKFANGLLMVS